MFGKGYAALSNMTTATDSVIGGLNEAYSYDSFGNINQNGNFGFQQTYTSANQISGWGYDASGNLLSDQFGNRYAYDAESQITSTQLWSGGSVSYVYDGDGNRVEKTFGSTVTDTIYFGGRPIARNTGGAWTDLIYGPSGLLAEVPGTQAALPTYRLLDHLGSEVGTIDPNNVVSLHDYAPFGQTFSGGTNDPYQFTGKERDTESGLDYFGARYYASNAGRWMLPDWSSVPEAVPYANLNLPATLNLYTYVGNNPITGRDVDGHQDGNKSNAHTGTSITVSGNCGPGSDDPAPCSSKAFDGAATGGAAQQQNQNLSPTDKAALKAETAALGPTRESVEEKNSHEYGGLIVRNNKNGRISSTDPVRGNGISIDVDSIPVPAGTTVIATYHSHPHSSAVEDGGASQGDVNNSAAHNNRPGYVLDSFSGRVYRYDGHTDARPFPAGTYIGTVQ